MMVVGIDPQIVLTHPLPGTLGPKGAGSGPNASCNDKVRKIQCFLFQFFTQFKSLRFHFMANAYIGSPSTVGIFHPYPNI